jgi:dTDP-4-dehydrorhamnose reductase
MEKITPRRILVTGASGLLGVNLALEATQAGHLVFGTYNEHALRLESKQQGCASTYGGGGLPVFQACQVDLLADGAIERLIDETQPDWVIHCAALANLDSCEAQPELAQRINAELPGRLAKHLAGSGTRLLHVSTDSVFDGVKGGYAETDAPNPLGVYSRTKLEGEQAVLAANSQAIVARVNLFGWSLTSKRSLGEFFIYNLRAGKKVMGFTDVFFCPLLANDLAQVFVEMLNRQLSGLYHTVGSEGLCKYDFGLRLAVRFGLDTSLIQPTSVFESGLKAARSPNLVLNTDKLAAVLGHALPALSPAIDRFYELDQMGYPQLLKELVVSD